MATQGIAPVKQSVEQKNSEYPQYIRNYASAHYACVMSYYLAKKGALHPTTLLHLTPHGTCRRQIIKQLPMLLGMYGYLLLPEDKSDPNVTAVFRGTDFAEQESALINLESQGPSSDSFPKVKDAVMAYIKDKLREHYGESMPDLHLSVHGHSQGSSTSQLFVTALLQERIDTHDFDHITALTMTNLNDPGVSHDIRIQADNLARQQFAQGKPLKLAANWGMVGGDIVQTLAPDMIFVRLPSDICEVNLLKIDKNLEGNWRKNLNLQDGLQWKETFKMLEDAFAGVMGAHSNINFFTMNKPNGKITTIPITVEHPYEYYSNKHPEQIPDMQNELLYKANTALAFFQGASKIIGPPCKLGYDLLKTCADALPLTAQDYLYTAFGTNGYFAHEIYQSYQRGDFDLKLALDFEPRVFFSDLANKVSGWFKRKTKTPSFTMNTMGILEPSKDTQVSTFVTSRSVRP